jgi:hypothetical protein
MDPKEIITGEDIRAGDAVVVGVNSQGNFVASKITVPRLKRYIYKHAHECSHKNELYVHRPMTIGSVMFPVPPVCIETEIELMRVRIEDDE